MPDEPTAIGLLALVLWHHARRTTRFDDASAAANLAEQDRDRSDAELADQTDPMIRGEARARIARELLRRGGWQG